MVKKAREEMISVKVKGNDLQRGKRLKETETVNANDDVSEDSNDNVSNVSESDGDEQEFHEAVASATSIITSMSSLEAVEDAFNEVKHRVQALVYSTRVGQMFSRVIDSKQELNPFKKQDKAHLKSLFQRCSVLAHEVFKDSEWTLSSRREACGATTTFGCEANEEMIIFVMTWYWRPDEEMGFFEEFSLTRRSAPVVTDSADDSDTDSEATEEVLLLEGIRSLHGTLQATIDSPALSETATMVGCKAAPQALLRFLVLCCRTECAKCRDCVSSVTHGFDAAEDADDVCRFLAAFEVPAAPPPLSHDPAATAGKPSVKRPAAAAAAVAPFGPGAEDTQSARPGKKARRRP
jgi:hypothetical protein